MAELRAKEAGTALEQGTFDWREYRSDRAETVGEWVERFHQQFEGAKLTWDKDYRASFNKLPPDAPLTAELLRQTLEGVKASKPNSRVQLRVYNAFRKLAMYADLSTDGLKGLKGSYSASEIDPRSLPTDEAIAKMRAGIKDDGWRWLFGMLAAYGLRGHAAYKVDLADFPTVRVLPDTKTGARFVCRSILRSRLQPIQPLEMPLSKSCE